MTRNEMIAGVNDREQWRDPAPPHASDNVAPREVLLVDRNGKPLMVREPRPIGFRKR